MLLNFFMNNLRKIKFDFYFRQNFSKYEFFKLFLKALSFNQYLPISYKKYFFQIYSILPKHTSICFIKNRCLLTGNTRSVFRKFNLSRWEIKKLGVKGDLPGLQKSSW